MKNKKEYRSIDVTLDSASESRTITGRIPYNSKSEFLGFYEMLAKGCFSKTLRESNDIRCLVEHNNQRLLARTKNGSLRFDDREDGLYFSFEAPDTTEGEDVLTMVRSGLTNGCSFGFSVVRDEYAYVDGYELRTIYEVKLYEVSVILSEPAYPDSDVYCRSLSQALENKESLNDDEQNAVKAEIEKLQAMLPKEEASKTEKSESKASEEEKKEEEAKKAEEEKAKEEEQKKIEELNARFEAVSKILNE